jgi:hypothetical protein
VMLDAATPVVYALGGLVGLGAALTDPALA